MRCNMEKQKKKLSKVKRIILWVLVVLIAVLAIALISFMAFLDGIVATAIRQVGPALTGTEVKVSDVTISLMDGRARISGFVVGNPEGYSTPEAMKFDEFFVDINLTSMLGGEELIINEIYIKSPRISLETSIYGGSNLGDIQEHLEQVTAAEESGEDFTAIEQNSDIIAHLHISSRERSIIKDSDRGYISEIAALLKKINYSGAISYEGGQSTEAQEIKHMFEILREYFGS